MQAAIAVVHPTFTATVYSVHIQDLKVLLPTVIGIDLYVQKLHRCRQDKEVVLLGLIEEVC